MVVMIVMKILIINRNWLEVKLGIRYGTNSKYQISNVICLSLNMLVIKMPVSLRTFKYFIFN